MEANDTYLTVTGMTCATCASTVERVLNKLDIVERSSVNLPLENVKIIFGKNATAYDLDTCIEVIEKAGFGAKKNVSAIKNRENRENEVTSQLKRVILALGLSIPVFLLTMVIDDFGSFKSLNVRLLMAMTFSLLTVSYTHLRAHET